LSGQSAAALARAAAASSRESQGSISFRSSSSFSATAFAVQLERAIDALPKGGILVVAEWDRATRSMLDGVGIIERIHARGTFIKVLDKPHLDLTTPLGRGFIAFVSAMPEDERQRIAKRAHEGRLAARARMGHREKLNEAQQADARRRLEEGESCRAIARVMRCHHATVSATLGRMTYSGLTRGPMDHAMHGAMDQNVTALERVQSPAAAPRSKTLGKD
jgi:DNA invertase Pin-like site-specific DNA recombinase